MRIVWAIAAIGVAAVLVFFDRLVAAGFEYVRLGVALLFVFCLAPVYAMTRHRLIPVEHVVARAESHVWIEDVILSAAVLAGLVGGWLGYVQGGPSADVLHVVLNIGSGFIFFGITALSICALIFPFKYGKILLIVFQMHAQAPLPMAGLILMPLTGLFPVLFSMSIEDFLASRLGYDFAFSDWPWAFDLALGVAMMTSIRLYVAYRTR